MKIATCPQVWRLLMEHLGWSDGAFVKVSMINCRVLNERLEVSVSEQSAWEFGWRLSCCVHEGKLGKIEFVGRVWTFEWLIVTCCCFWEIVLCRQEFTKRMNLIIEFLKQ